MPKPKKWIDVYPQGTEEGNEEQRFFIALSRNNEWPYRSTAMIAKDSGLSTERVEEIIEKYLAMGIVFQHEKNENQWIYWERDLDLIKKEKSLAEKDQDKRIAKSMWNDADK